VVLTNEVNLRRARLVLGWVTVYSGSTPGDSTLFRYVTSHPGQLSLLKLVSDAFINFRTVKRTYKTATILINDDFSDSGDYGLIR